jgi:hypothetical protein
MKVGDLVKLDPRLSPMSRASDPFYDELIDGVDIPALVSAVNTFNRGETFYLDVLFVNGHTAECVHHSKFVMLSEA